MNDKIICYSELPKYSEHADPKKRSVIELTKLQAWLAKQLVNDSVPLTGRLLARIWGVFLHGILLTIIFFLARNLLFLGYFHGAYPETISSVKYIPKGKMVLVVMNVDREPNWTQDK